MIRGISGISAIRRAVASGGGGGGGISVLNAWKNQAATTTVAVTVSPTAGNALVLVISNYQGSASTHAVSDNIGLTTGWTKVVTDDASSPNAFSIWIKLAIPSGITTITITAALAATCQGYVHEISGVTTWTSGEAVFNPVIPGNSTPTAGPLTNATATSIYFAALSILTPSGNPAAAQINWTGSTGTWILKDLVNSQELDANNWIVTSVPYQIVSTSTSRSHVWTTDGAQGYAGVVCLH